jgi:hypothetical protein
MLMVHHGCGYEKEISVLCPQCGLPFCEEDTMQAIGGILAQTIVLTEILKKNLRNVIVVNADYDVLINDEFIFGDATNGDLIITLPFVINSVGKVYTVMKINSGSKDLTIKPQVGEKINGDVKEVINSKYASRTIISDGVEWFIYARTS